ncbi:MAG: hypothetical protein MRJ67_00605 [Nitrospirales bacterium]|nr:hypothetical protein [Nitrospira sp.]MDR4459017.1 hypothetical protein [Nitrospirales bacterium]MDR4483611.1 hypothetical protein [Nitrospirales bacterium]
MNRLHNAWNGDFICSSLAGMLCQGVTGFQVAHQDTPEIVNGFVSLPSKSKTFLSKTLTFNGYA